MKAVVLALCCLFAVALGQTAFTADFQLRHPFMQGGVVAGTISYSWDGLSYKLSFPGKTTAGSPYQEIFTFNTARGYDTTSDRPFHNQWVYRSGHTCACETGPNDAAMPQLFVGASGVTSAYQQGAGSLTINGVQCQEYNRITGSKSQVTKLYWDAAGNRVCRAIFTDLREITFTNVQAQTQIAASVFTPPEGCKCGQPIDLSIVLDRSGSISIKEFGNQKSFVEGFVNKFSYGPLGANLALVHFNTPAWTTLTMTEGVSQTNVNTAINALACCSSSSNPDDSCCCCGTSISAGMRMGADQLALGRANTEKILIVVTDGYHNHDYQGRGCARDSVACRSDLQAATDYAKATVPGVKIYAVGVGSDRDVSDNELMIIADGHAERKLRYTDFTNLAQNSLDLVARACQETVNPCGGCCGFCVCGQCTAPDQCDSTSFCNPNAVSGVCCKQEPRQCDLGQANKCFEYTCNEAQSQCISAPVTCKTNTNCHTYACEPATGNCITTPTGNCAGQPECASDLDCNDNNACTTDRCNPTTFVCEWTNSAQACDDKNACTLDECDVAVGCRHTPFTAQQCNDTNVCTTDSCDPAQGCVHTPITCPSDDNLCTDDVCDPFKGCINKPVVCGNDGKEDCKISFCQEGTCKSRDADNCTVPVAAIVAPLTTAAIIGIIIGVVLCVAGVGGGSAYAYSQAMGTGNVAPVANNPIYRGGGNAGTNPLYNNNRS